MARSRSRISAAFSKRKLLRRLFHLGGEVRLHLFKPALQQGDRLGDGLVVLLLQIFRAAVAVALAMWKFRQGRSLPMSRGNFFRQEGRCRAVRRASKMFWVLWRLA